MNSHRTLFSRISNNIFLLSTILILSFIWINYYLRNLYLSLCSAVIILLFFCIIYYPIRICLNKKSINKKNTTIKKNELETQLLLGKNSDNLELLTKLYNIKNLSQTLDNTHFTTNNEDIFVILNKEILTEQDIINAIKNRQFNSIKIYCIDAPKFPKLTEINIEIINFENIYNKINSQNYTIENIINLEKSSKLRAKEYLCIIFNKERSRGYFGFGFLLLFSSLFTPYHTYYIIVGTILLLTSIYSRFNKKYN